MPRPLLSPAQRALLAEIAVSDNLLLVRSVFGGAQLWIVEAGRRETHRGSRPARQTRSVEQTVKVLVELRVLELYKEVEVGGIIRRWYGVEER